MRCLCIDNQSAVTLTMADESAKVHSAPFISYVKRSATHEFELQLSGTRHIYNAPTLSLNQNSFDAAMTLDGGASALSLDASAGD